MSIFLDWALVKGCIVEVKTLLVELISHVLTIAV